MKKIAILLIALILSVAALTLCACGKECEHEFGAWIVTANATCGQAGSQSHTCTLCGKVETEEIPATGDHLFSRWTEILPSTCGEAGIKKRVCTVCTTAETGAIPKLEDHYFGDWEVVTPSTCIAAGTEKHVCLDCGHEESRDLLLSDDHAYGDPTYAYGTLFVPGTKTEVCTLCQYVNVTPANLPGVVLAEDYNEAFELDNKRDFIRGIEYNAVGKEAAFLVATHGGESCLKCLLPVASRDPLMNFNTVNVLGDDMYLVDLLEDGKFTFSFNLAKDAEHQIPVFMLRLRGAEGSGDTIVSLGTTLDGVVYALTEENVVTTLTDVFRTISLTVDFTNSKITYYVNGEEKLEVPLSLPIYSSAANFADWTSASPFVFNGYFPQNETEDEIMLFIDKVVILRGGYQTFLCEAPAED